MKLEPQELADELMRGEELCGEVEAMRFVAERRLQQAYAEWSGIKAGLPAGDQEAGNKCERAMMQMRNAVREFAASLKELADVLHKRRSEVDPDSAADTDPVAYARKVTGQ